MKLRPRLSLLNLLLLTAVVASWYGALTLYLREEPLRAEICALERGLVGIDVGDESLIHAAEIYDPAWRPQRRWRLWVPEGTSASVVFHVSSPEIFDTDSSAERLWLPTGPSTIWIAADWRRGYNPEDQQIYSVWLDGRGEGLWVEGPATTEPTRSGDRRTALGCHVVHRL